jgi:hypothetical protein
LNQKRFGTSFASAISNHTLEASKQMHRNMAELVNGTFYRIYHGFTVPHIYLNISTFHAPKEVQKVFERYVGPITHCNLVEDAASITFLSPDHAQERGSTGALGAGPWGEAGAKPTIG